MNKTNTVNSQITQFYQSRFTKTLYHMFKEKNSWKNVLYIHTPFCSQKCNYCVYHSYVPTSKEQSDFYHIHLPKQVEQYHKILNEVAFDEVYFGGGTPTIASSKTLESIFRSIPHFDEIPTKMIEAHPRSLTKAHIDLLSRYRFNYLSLGIQTLSNEILKKQNRLHISKEKLIDICSQLNNINIIYNIDLIFFLDTGELPDLKQGREDLIYVLSILKPTSVVIHLNYRVKKSPKKNNETIKLIKEVLRTFPAYKCVNSLLHQKDAFNDSQFNAEYRLMRNNYDFDCYLLGKYPNLPVYGYNIVGLGNYKKMSITSNYYHFIFRLLDSGIFLQQSELILQQIKNLYLNYKQIRSLLHLKYMSVSPNFFLKNSSQAHISKLKREMKHNPFIINLPKPKEKYHLLDP